jgi:hypothetical protein
MQHLFQFWPNAFIIKLTIVNNGQNNKEQLF